MNNPTPRMAFPRESDALVRKSTFNTLVERLDSTLSGSVAAASADLYLDPDAGDDAAADGTSVRPFKTIAALRASGRLPQIISQQTTVWIRKGVLTEPIRVDNTLLLRSLRFRPWLLPSEVAVLPYPFNLFWNSFITPQISGLTHGLATGGTKWRIEKTGAGWTPGELRGKLFAITAGTHWFTNGRIMDNGADWFEISGFQSTPFDATDYFYIVEEPVSVRPPNTSSSWPLVVLGNSGAGTLEFTGIKFEMNDNRYQNYCSYFYGNQCYVYFDSCSFIGNAPATFSGATFQLLVSIQRNVGAQFSFSSCDFYIPAVKAGTTTGALWSVGPNAYITISNSTIVDNVQAWDVCDYLRISSCTQKYRTGMLQYNYTRAVDYCAISFTRMDWNNAAWGWRTDGRTHFDIRNCVFERGLQYGFKSYDHHGNQVNGMMEYTELNGCSINGVDLGGNSYFTFRAVTTDPTKLNGVWGAKARSGTQFAYLGAANTLAGSSGQVNLGDNVTPVNWGTPTTDLTHLTRLAPMGG